MNEKINIQELVALLAQKSEITKKEAETFLKECLDTINDALLKDQSVKVRNLGTFKLSSVSDRESVNVATGERVMIPAHYKVGFSADNAMAQAVNEPFDLLPSVEVNEDNEVINSEETIVFEEEEIPNTDAEEFADDDDISDSELISFGEDAPDTPPAESEPVGQKTAEKSDSGDFVLIMDEEPVPKTDNDFNLTENPLPTKNEQDIIDNTPQDIIIDTGFTENPVQPEDESIIIDKEDPYAVINDFNSPFDGNVSDFDLGFEQKNPVLPTIIDEEIELWGDEKDKPVSPASDNILEIPGNSYGITKEPYIPTILDDNEIEIFETKKGPEEKVHESYFEPEPDPRRIGRIGGIGPMPRPGGEKIITDNGKKKKKISRHKRKLNEYIRRWMLPLRLALLLGVVFVFYLAFNGRGPLNRLFSPLSVPPIGNAETPADKPDTAAINHPEILPVVTKKDTVPAGQKTPPANTGESDPRVKAFLEKMGLGKDLPKTKTDSVAANSKPPKSPVVNPPEKKNPPASASADKKVTIQNGETLAHLALREYGNRAFWVYIYEENRSVIANPDDVSAGTELIIPSAAKYGIDKNSPESISKARERAGKIAPKPRARPGVIMN